MKKQVLVSGILAAAMMGAVALSTTHSGAAAAAPQQAAPRVKPADLTGTWAIDNAHTEIGFAVTHLGVSKTRGRFTEFDGSLKVDGQKPENSSVEVAIKVDSINTGNPKRDEHLRGADFFDAAKYPYIRFKSNSIKKTSNNAYIANGNLTIKNVTKPILLRFTPTTAVKGPDGKLHAGMSTSVSINRKEYGLTWNGIVEGVQAVGDMVDISIDLEAIKQ
ncbi:MAG: YceI family protein [Armatimonadaceae bacterium]